MHFWMTKNYPFNEDDFYLLYSEYKKIYISFMYVNRLGVDFGDIITLCLFIFVHIKSGNGQQLKQFI